MLGSRSTIPTMIRPIGPTWRALAVELGLIHTGSSDYHGTNKVTRLGACTTAPEQYERIVAAGRYGRRLPAEKSVVASGAAVAAAGYGDEMSARGRLRGVAGGLVTALAAALAVAVVALVGAPAAVGRHGRRRRHRTADQSADLRR